MRRFSRQDLEGFVTRVLVRLGVPESDARLVADCLIYANLSGVDSHGIVRLPHYVTRLENRSINAMPEITMRQPRSSILSVDGDDGLGHVVTSRAVSRGMEICRETGSVMISVGNSSHFGMAGYYLRDITQAGLVGMVTTHTDVRIVPDGARKPFAGTNPIAYGFPTGGEPLVLDFATTSVSFGKIALARAENREIPADWGLDENGDPTTNPHKLEGMHAIAGHKGAGLAMIIDLFSSMFSSMPYGPHINRMYEELDAPRKLGHFISLWDIGALVPVDEVRARMDGYIAELHALPRQQPDIDVMFPGEPEARRRAERTEAGIPIEQGLLAELEQLAARIHIDGPSAAG